MRRFIQCFKFPKFKGTHRCRMLSLNIVTYFNSFSFSVNLCSIFQKIFFSIQNLFLHKKSSRDSISALIIFDDEEVEII